MNSGSDRFIYTVDSFVLSSEAQNSLPVMKGIRVYDLRAREEGISFYEAVYRGIHVSFVERIETGVPEVKEEANTTLQYIFCNV